MELVSRVQRQCAVIAHQGVICAERERRQLVGHAFEMGEQFRGDRPARLGSAQADIDGDRCGVDSGLLPLN